MSNKENDCVQKNVHLMQQFQEIVQVLVQKNRQPLKDRLINTINLNKNSDMNNAIFTQI